MGVDISGGMIVGAIAEGVEGAVGFESEDGDWVYQLDEDTCEDFYEWYEYHGMETYSMWYDSGNEGKVVGFKVPDINPLGEDFDEWIENVKTLATEFKEITGIDPELIGMQNVW